MKLPSDLNSLDIELFNLIVTRAYRPISNSHLYGKIKDPMNKFIACYVFEAGNTQKEAEIATGLSKATIWRRIKEIKECLGKYYGEKKLTD